MDCWSAGVPSAARSAAVASRDQARADAAAASHGIPLAYGRYADMLANPDLDATRRGEFHSV